MCGRYTLFKKFSDIQDFLNANDVNEFELTSNYNVAPSDVMLITYESDDHKRIIDKSYWRFMAQEPNEDKKTFLPINTWDDSIAKKPRWKKSFLNSRCIIPSNGYYEWHGKKEINYEF